MSLIEGRSTVNDWSHPVAVGLLFLISIFGVLFYWFNLAIRGPPFTVSGDLANTWRPFAHCVLNGGQLYLCQWDNKPPLFHFFNVAFASTGHYLFLFFLTMGIANWIASLLIWRLCGDWGYETVGVVSAFLFVTLMSGMTWRVNPRNYSTVFLLLALLSTRPFRSGVYLALAGLFSQFAVFLIPAIVWLSIKGNNHRLRWFTTFVAGGLILVGSVYGMVAIVWSPEAALTGFNYAFLSSGQYVASYSHRGLSLYGDPVAWTYKLYRLLKGLLWLVLGGSVGVYAIFVKDWLNRRFGVTIVLSTLLASVPLTIRTANVYLVLIAPFLSILFVVGIEYCLNGGLASQVQ